MADTLSDSLRGIIGGTAVVFVGNAVGMGGSFITKLLAARHLEPANYGLIALGITLLNITTLFVLLGFHQGLAQRIPRIENADELFTGAFLLSILISIVITVTVVYFSTSLSRVFGGDEFAPVLRMFGLALPFMVILELSVSGFRGLGNAAYRVLAKDILFKGTLVVFVAIGVATGMNPIGIASAWPLSLVVATVGAMYLLIRKTSLLSLNAATGDVNPNAVYSLAVFSLPLLISGASWVLMQQVDIVLLDSLGTLSEVGIYDAAYSLAMVLSMVVASFNFLFVPTFSRLHKRNEQEVMERFYKIVTKWTTFVVVPPTLLLVLYPREIVVLFYGSNYSTGGTALTIVAIGLFVTAITGNANGGLVALGKSRAVLRGNLLALVVNIFINMLLIPVYGIVGAALATLLSYVVVNLHLGYHLYAKTEIHSLSRPFVRSTLVSGVALLATYQLLEVLFQDIRLRLAVAALLLVPYVGFLALSGGIAREEIDTLNSIDERIDVNLSPLIAVLNRLSDKSIL